MIADTSVRSVTSAQPALTAFHLESQVFELEAAYTASGRELYSGKNHKLNTGWDESDFCTFLETMFSLGETHS